MIEWLKYRLAIRRAIAQSQAREEENTARIDKAETEFTKLYEKLLENRMFGDDIRFSQESHEHEIKLLKYEIVRIKRDVAEVHTNYIRRESEKLGVPLPGNDQDEMWLHDGVVMDSDYRVLLSPKGIHAAKAAIRKERKERFEPWKDRAALLFGAGGFVVAALALTLRILEVAGSHPASVPVPTGSKCETSPAVAVPLVLPAPLATPRAH